MEWKYKSKYERASFLNSKKFTKGDEKIFLIKKVISFYKNPKFKKLHRLSIQDVLWEYCNVTRNPKHIFRKHIKNVDFVTGSCYTDNEKIGMCNKIIDNISNV